MARRSDHSREELYTLALGAARQIVEADGFRALTARQVADAIGYSPGTLYNLFANLDDLILHLNGQTLDRLTDRLSQCSIQGKPEQDLQELLDAYLGFLEENAELWEVLFQHRLPAGVTAPAWYDAKIGRALEIVETVLAPYFSNEQAEQRRQAATTLWAGLHGVCSLAEADKLRAISTQSMRQMAGTLVSVFSAGLKAAKADTI